MFRPSIDRWTSTTRATCLDGDLVTEARHSRRYNPGGIGRPGRRRWHSNSKVDEPVKKGVPRNALQQVTKAIDALNGWGGGTPEERVHDARKRLKRVRALVRLARGGLGRKCARRQDARLRDAGRPLSEMRDADVLVDTLDDLIARLGDQGRPEAITLAREALSRRKRELGRRLLDEQGVLAKVAHALGEVRRDVRHWDVAGDDWEALEAGLKRISRRGRRAFHEASSSPTDENLHEWRKRVKDLWYVMDILRPIRPGYTGRRGDQAHALADLLGDDHDLAVLREVLSTSGDGAAVSAWADVLPPLIERRRVELRRDAFALGPSLHGERPRAFVERLAAYWRAWRSEADAARFESP